MYTGLLSPTHLLLVLVIILLLFGADRLPELGRSLGQSIQEFKEGLATKEAAKEDEVDSAGAVEEAQENPRSSKS